MEVSAEQRRSIFDILHNDCLELIFAYLTLEEKARYERVCKRWKANMYRYQNVFEMNDLKGRKIRNALIEVLSIVTQKCEFIEKVDLTQKYEFIVRVNFFSIEQYLDVIGNNCVHLAEIVIDVDHEGTMDALIDFGKKFGQRLKRFTCSWEMEKLNMIKEKLIEFLEECVNLQEITLTEFEVLKENDAHFLPKLKRITVSSTKKNYESEIDFLIRNVRYAKCLTNIYVSGKELEKKFISLIPSLRRLEIAHLRGMKPEVITSLTEHCSQTLQCITITIINPSDETHPAMLKYHFVVCPKLIEFNFLLHFVQYSSPHNIPPISNHIFDNITSSFPALVRLTIQHIFDERSVDTMLCDLMKFNKIQHLTLFNHEKKEMLLSNVALNQLVNSFPHLKSLYLTRIHEANEETIKSLVELANSRPTRNMRMSIFTYGTGEHFQLGYYKNLQLELGIRVGSSMDEEMDKYRKKLWNNIN